MSSGQVFNLKLGLVENASSVQELQGALTIYVFHEDLIANVLFCLYLQLIEELNFKSF